ncbi:hypothetical protein BHM03_00015363 [Ensete ventricosum]|uniref:Uncharacterized protein n=1 Tax=Ensete ventricosum TaxID=4639 RepID=A0A427B5K4_ENSVE|nr:hypothetical protein B296_00001220 [Ensete ventricosum]RZR87898.1 hypothetical protein BHM03_00015363 [Ensete ventricosum]
MPRNIQRRYTEYATRRRGSRSKPDLSRAGARSLSSLRGERVEVDAWERSEALVLLTPFASEGVGFVYSAPVVHIAVHDVCAFCIYLIG